MYHLANERRKMRFIIISILILTATEVYSQYTITSDTAVIRPGIFLVRTTYEDTTEIMIDFDTIVFRDTTYEKGYRTVHLLSVYAKMLINKRVKDTVNYIDSCCPNRSWNDLKGQQSVWYNYKIAYSVNRDKRIPQYDRAWQLFVYNFRKHHYYREKF